MQQITLRPFLAGILALKTVLQSAPEHTIFIQRIGKFSGEGHPSVPRPARLRRSTLAPLPYKILDTPLSVTVSKPGNTNLIFIELGAN